MPLLYNAVRDGLVVVVRERLLAGDDVNETGVFGRSALFTACQNGNIEIVTMLLEAGADVNAVNHEGVSPLMNALNFGHEHVAELLVDFGANCVVSNVTNYATIHAAARSGCIKFLRRLLALGVSINLRGGSKRRTPLCEAAYNGSVELVQFLLENGADPSIADTSGKKARAWGSSAAVCELLDEWEVRPRVRWRPETHRLFSSGVRAAIMIVFLLSGWDVEHDRARFPAAPFHVLPLELVFLVCEFVALQPSYFLDGTGLAPSHSLVGRVEGGGRANSLGGGEAESPLVMSPLFTYSPCVGNDDERSFPRQAD